MSELKRISVIVTFHREGILAHNTLISYAMSRDFFRAEGGEVEFVLVLDRADEATSHIVRSHPLLDGTEKVVDTNFGDLALARNAGIAEATADYIAVLDGDDLISRRYFIDHFREAQKLGRNVVLHSEMVLSFGMYNAFNWQVDQDGEYFNRASLLTINPWISGAFAHRSVFESVPYVACHWSCTGFGFEDWHWNCETIANGIVHRLAWGAVYFYRRKWSGSLNEAGHQIKAVMPKSRLFSTSLRAAAQS